MRELERDSLENDPALPSVAERAWADHPRSRVLAIVGQGRLGRALIAELSDAGIHVEGERWEVAGPFGRGYDGAQADAVLLCVPDGEIAAAARLITRGRLVGHCSGASGLDGLAPHERFSFHPLLPVIPGQTEFAGAGAAIAGTSARAVALAEALAQALGMRTVEVAEADRPAYHAAASIASNFLITLEAAAEQVAATAGVSRELLGPLVRGTVENWVALGPERALTGPVARGDDATIAAHRAAVAERAPQLLNLFDELLAATRALAHGIAHEPEADTAERTRRCAEVRVLRTVPELRHALAEARRGGRSVGLVPTMGAFHPGHLSLMRRARAECDVVVVSLFVNPTQFNDPADLAAYPRDERQDVALAHEAGVDIIFAPAPSDLYPDGFATVVSVPGLGEVLEGAHRGAGHFTGVATIVAKLLNIVAPDIAYFGQKDAQQSLVIRRLVDDLNIPVRIEICPTVRAPDGLALSSRNARLSAPDRERAAALYRSLRTAEEAIRAGVREPAAVIATARRELSAGGVEPEYFALVDPDSFMRADSLEDDVLAVVAASIRGTRLIDNHLIHVPAAPREGEANTDPALALAAPAT